MLSLKSIFAGKRRSSTMGNFLDEKNKKLFILFYDLGIISLSFYLAFYIRFENIPTRNIESFYLILPWMLVISFFFLSIYEVNSLRRKTSSDFFVNVLVSNTFIFFFIMGASFFFRAFALPRSVIGLAFTLSVILMWGWKTVYLLIKKSHKDGTVLVISTDIEKERIIPQVKQSLAKGTNIIHMLPKAELSDIKTTIQGVDYVIMGSEVKEDIKAKIIYHSVKCSKNVYVIPSLYDLLLSKSDITSIEDTMALAVKPFGLSIDQQLFKRLFDIVISLLSIIILLPVYVIVSILIKIEEPKGSIFYKQKRIGKDNKEFVILKFRTMIENAEAKTGPTLATDHDPRITKIGKFLRQSRLDEIPQFFNVLKGDMSIVGPRPEREYFIKKFRKSHKSYQYRNTVKPGITGYAQIMGKYTTSVEDKLRFDLHYIRNYSFILDVVILFRTLITVLDKTKAEGKSTSEVKTSKSPKKIPLEL